MQTGLVPPKLACAVYSVTAGANFIQGRKRAFYTVQGRGRGGRHVQKVVKCIRERGACRRERKRRETCLERKE